MHTQASFHNLPPEGSISRVFFCDFFLYIQLFTYVHYLYIDTESPLFWVICGSAEQPLQVPDGRALSQPRPHPSDKIV